MRLAGETALVTGSTAGIGLAVARRFALEGARVVVTGRDATRGKAVADEIGDAAVFLAADLASEDETTALVARAADAFGSLTVLVNNAVTADAVDAVAGAVTTEAWDAILRVNLTAPLWLTRATIPHMIAAGHGSIVNVSSRAAVRATPALAAYVASKGGLNALTRSIAVDYAAAGIRANTISPGYVLNERRDAHLSDERRARLEGMHLTRLALADDVAHAAVYLASRESEVVTGTDLALDGGSTIARGLAFG